MKIHNRVYSLCREGPRLVYLFSLGLYQCMISARERHGD